MTVPAHLELMHQLYTEALEEGANDAERVGWEAISVQELRYEALLEALAPNDLGSATRVLDVGCGFGDLYAWLERTGRAVDYTGIDVLEPMVEEARRRYPGVRFECVDLFDFEDPSGFDLVVCSGALSIRFGTLDSEPHQDAESWAFIARLYELATWAAAFNVQSDREIDDVGARDLRSDFWYVPPARILDRAHDLARTVVVREDTVPSDAICYLYRDYCRTSRALVARGVHDLVDVAEIALQRDAWDEARDAADQAVDELAAGPRQTRARFLRGVATAYEGEVDGARSDLEAALAAEPELLDARRSLLHLYLAADETEAGWALVQAVNGPSGQARRRDELRMTMHEHLVGVGDHERAHELTSAAETAFGEAFMAGGSALAACQWDAASAAFERAIDARPADGRPRVLWAAAAERLGRHEEALEACMTVLDVAPTHEIARSVSLDAMRKLARIAAGQSPAAQAALDVLTAAADHAVIGLIAERLCHGLSRS